MCIGDDGMRKRVLAMMHFMNLDEVKQNNMGRVKLDIDKFVQEVRKNDGRILFDAVGYRRYVDEETRANEYVEVEQIRRPKVITSVPPPPRPMEQNDTGSDTGYFSEKPRHQGSGTYQGGMNPSGNGRRGKPQGMDGRKPQSDDYYGSSNSSRKRDRSPSNDYDYYGPSPSNRKRDPSPAHGQARSSTRGYADVEGDGFVGLDKKPRASRPRSDDGRNSRGLNSLHWEDPPTQQHDNSHRNKDLQWEDPPHPQHNLRWEAPPRRDEQQKVNPFAHNASRGYNI